MNRVDFFAFCVLSVAPWFSSASRPQIATGVDNLEPLSSRLANLLAHFHKSAGGQKPTPVDCGKDIVGQRVMLLANGLANDDLKSAFADMVKDYAGTTKNNELKALVFWDSCYLKESVWNRAWERQDGPASGGPGAANADAGQLDARNTAKVEEAMKEYFGKIGKTGTPQLEDWGCEDFSESLIDIIDNKDIDHVSLINLVDDDVKLTRLLDELAAPQKSSEPKLSSKDALPKGIPQDEINQVLDAAKKKASDAFPELQKRIDAADILAFDGGNPDVHALGIGLFGEPLKKILRDKAAAGTVFIGRSAGAMILTSAIVTYEPQPAIHNHLLYPDIWPTMEGLGLVGTCAIRPHWAEKWLNGGDFFEANFKLTPTLPVKVLNVRNGEGATCIKKVCQQLLHTPTLSNDKTQPSKAACDAACADMKKPCPEPKDGDCVMPWRICFKACVDAYEKPTA
eukprot:TRINITY_DN22163_c0_g1_i1.p1 TRINITY_DN22163_c0_g1~~TRINITY_DN22163_c0_g1_i1.p1  ORF type:complete len:455 (-),score=53.54 TRINITY_DN22163_c0_g1_i1:240-1604(-)